MLPTSVGVRKWLLTSLATNTPTSLRYGIRSAESTSHAYYLSHKQNVSASLVSSYFLCGLCWNDCIEPSFFQLLGQRDLYGCSTSLSWPILSLPSKTQLKIFPLFFPRKLPSVISNISVHYLLKHFISVSCRFIVYLVFIKQRMTSNKIARVLNAFLQFSRMGFYSWRYGRLQSTCFHFYSFESYKELRQKKSIGCDWIDI